MRRGLVRHIVFLVFVFSVGGYAYYEHFQIKQTEIKKTAKRFFLKQKLDALLEIKIKNSKEVILLSKKNQDWFLESPIKDKASFSEVARWFDEIRNQKIREITTEKDIVWKDYYLEKSPKVSLKFSDGSQVSFLVSSKNSFDDKAFVKKDNKLFMGEKYFVNEVNLKSFQSFRNKKIIPSYGHAVKIVIKNKQTLSFYWANYSWLFKEKDFPLNSDRLDSFWTTLSSIEALSVKERSTPFYLKKYGLNQAKNQIKLSYDKNQKVTLKISAIKNDLAYVYASHRDYILEISKEDAEKLQLSKNDIRNHSKAFHYDQSKVSSLELKSENFSYSLVNKKDKWTSLSSPNKKLDSKKVQIVLNSIYELKGKKYKKGKLGKVSTSILIKDTSSKVLLDFQSSFASKSMVWIQTNLSKDLVAIPKASLDFILNKDISFSEVILKKEKSKK